jgi:hypothetical protein
MSRQQPMWFATAFAVRKPVTAGCRTPHLCCGDGSSLHDAIGPKFHIVEG